MQEQFSVTDFYTDFVLPALSERLDQAFPEFGWRRDPRGWIATNEEYTHSRLGVRAARVVAHGPAPRGFLVHGGEPTLWTAYVSCGVVPRGVEFIHVVKDLAARAGVDSTPIERAAPRDRRADLLHDFFELCKFELASETGLEARSYLERRGFSEAMIESSSFGLVDVTAAPVAAGADAAGVPVPAPPPHAATTKSAARATAAVLRLPCMCPSFAN